MSEQMGGIERSRCGCPVGGLHQYACALVGCVDPPRTASGAPIPPEQISSLHISGGKNTLNVPQPTKLTIVEPGGGVLLTVHADGRWEFRDDAAPTEAAHVFVHSVLQIVGDQRRAWERAVLWDFVAHVPGEGQAVDFINVIANAMIRARNVDLAEDGADRV